MASTERTVRERISKAITTLGPEKLGFVGPVNVRDYLLEYERQESIVQYLMSAVDGGGKKIRAIAVHVDSHDAFWGAGQLYKRMYRILIRFYYGVGTEGEGIKTLIDHMRTVRGAVLDLGPSIDGTVDDVSDFIQPTFEIADSQGLDSDGRMIVGTIELQAERQAPDF